MANTFNISVAPQIAVIDGKHNVAGADSVLNAYMRDAIGNKADAIDMKVAANVSLMAYIKGQIQELDQRSVAKFTSVKSLTAAFVDVVNITDKGVLTGIMQKFDADTVDSILGYLQVTIDGVMFLNISESSTFNKADPNNQIFSLAFNHRFNTSILVQHKANNAVGERHITTAVSYTIDAP